MPRNESISSSLTGPTVTSAAPAAAFAAATADPESAGLPPHKPTSHFRLLVDRAGITPEVLAYPYPGEGTEESPYIVSFLEHDPRNPQELATWKKWTYTLTMAFATLAIAFVSTAYSGGISAVEAELHVSSEVAILGISLFVLGFAVGPLLWAPLSEIYGRQILFTGTYAAVTIFNGACTAAQNIETLVILRFFAGAFGSSPLTNAGGVIADMFSANERGLAAAIFAAAPFLGPSLGPICAGFLGEAAGWRWVEGMMTIFTGVMLIVGTLIVPETYAPFLLRERAAALSKKTGKVYVSRMEAHWHLPGKDGSPPPPKPSAAAQFGTAMMRPWVLLFKEPIVLITSLYMAIVYGTMYMMFPAFAIVFEAYRGWSAGMSGLAFLGITAGMVFSVAYSMYDSLTRYKRVAEANNGAAPPEARLFTGCVGAVLIPIGLFWFAWTNMDPVHWIVPIIGSAFFSAGLVLVFLSLMNYLIDSYVVFAASTLAANAVLRSLFGAAFPLFTTYMYQNLGLHWASSIPAFLSLACVPFPFFFIRYGKQIRMRCKFAAEAAVILSRMRAQHENITPEDEEEAIEDEAIEEAGVEMQRRASRASRVSRANSHASAGGRMSRINTRLSQVVHGHKSHEGHASSEKNHEHEVPDTDLDTDREAEKSE